MKARELVQLLQRNGWVLVRTRADHWQSQHPDRARTITVSGSTAPDVPPGTLAQVLEAAGRNEGGR